MQEKVLSKVEQSFGSYYRYIPQDGLVGVGDIPPPFVPNGYVSSMLPEATMVYVTKKIRILYPRKNTIVKKKIVYKRRDRIIAPRVNATSLADIMSEDSGSLMLALMLMLRPYMAKTLRVMNATPKEILILMYLRNIGDNGVMYDTLDVKLTRLGLRKPGMTLLAMRKKGMIRRFKKRVFCTKEAAAAIGRYEDLLSEKSKVTEEALYAMVPALFKRARKESIIDIS